MPTALELGPESWKRYQGLPARVLERAELTEDERCAREQLMRRVRQAADALKVRFGVRRVVLFGSLAHEAWFVPDSDVDLAVTGLRTEDYWRAWRLAEDIIAGPLSGTGWSCDDDLYAIGRADPR
jgi:predicted nucleotidyltransferase